MLKTDYKFGEVINLNYQFPLPSDKVGFQHLWNNDNGGVVLMTFGPCQKLDEHLTPAQVMIYVVEGEIDFTMIDRKMSIPAGHFIMLGKGVPHSVYSANGAKVMLIKVNIEKG